MHILFIYAYILDKHDLLVSFNKSKVSGVAEGMLSTHTLNFSKTYLSVRFKRYSSVELES